MTKILLLLFTIKYSYLSHIESGHRDHVDYCDDHTGRVRVIEKDVDVFSDFIYFSVEEYRCDHFEVGD